VRQDAYTLHCDIHPSLVGNVNVTNIGCDAALHRQHLMQPDRTTQLSERPCRKAAASALFAHFEGAIVLPPAEAWLFLY
jgi:hypothetical protein